MEIYGETAPIPGSRIGGYRNSSPRLIRLFGLGEQGSRIAREVAARGFPNVEVLTDASPVGWDDIAKERPGDERTNMIVVVCGEGDERLFSPKQGKPDMLVTFVVVKEGGGVHPGSGATRANARPVRSIRNDVGQRLCRRPDRQYGELSDGCGQQSGT